MYQNRLESKHTARSIIKGQWLALLVCGLLLGLLSSAPAAIIELIRTATDGAANTVLGTLSALASIAAVVMLFPAFAGLERKYLTVARGGDRQEASVWHYYKEHDWLDKLVAYVIVSLIVAVGCVLLIVPGIIFALKYSVLGFVFADNPGIGWREALDKCNEVTKGRKWELFVFQLSFFGWHFLAIFTLGILEIWIAPYEETAFAAWYDIYCPKLEVIEEQPFSDDIFNG